MENLTHTCVGYLLARTGLRRLSPSGTAALVIGANLPDIDVLYALSGDLTTYLVHHRGLSHSFVGLVGLSLIQTTILWAIGRCLHRKTHPEHCPHFGSLFLLSLIALTSHFILDYTNSYGIRPWLPFSNQWYYGDLVFIADPYLWLLLGGSCVWYFARRLWSVVAAAVLAVVLTGLVFTVGSTLLPDYTKLIWLLGLTAIGVGWLCQTRPLGERVAQGALILLVCYWAGLQLCHDATLSKVRTMLTLPSEEAVNSVDVLPTAANPFQWQAFAQTNHLVYTAQANLFGAPTISELTVAGTHSSDAPASRTALVTAQGTAMRLFARYLSVEVRQKSGMEEVTLRDVRFSRIGRPGFAVVTIPVPTVSH